MTEEAQEQDLTETAPEADGPADTPNKVWEGAGVLLRQAREASGFTIVDAARQLKLGVRQIEALEADDFSKLPGPTFVRGFIRNYAKLLQIDPQPVLEAYLRTGPLSPAQVIASPDDQVSFSEHPRNFQIRYGIALVVVVAVAGAALYHWSPLKGAGPQQTTAGKPAAVPLPHPEEAKLAAPAPMAPQVSPPGEMPAQPTVAAASPNEAVPPITLSFSGDSWVEIRDQAGKIVFSQLNHANSQQTVQGTPPFELVIGNAPAVRLSYKGKPVDLSAFTRADVARITLD
jgi:cytoskeleton protein RodZ